MSDKASDKAILRLTHFRTNSCKAGSFISMMGQFNYQNDGLGEENFLIK